MDKNINNALTCENCGCVVEDSSHTVNGLNYCDDCFAELFETCEICGTAIPTGEEMWCENDNSVVCDNCYEQHYRACDNCDESYRSTNMYHDGNQYICRRCINDFYTCDDCECYVHEDNVVRVHNAHGCNHYCEDCAPSHTASIYDYSYKPEPIFHGKGELYLGVELEVDYGGGSCEDAAKIMSVTDESFLYVKHDGSLDDGFELVSHPCTLNYHVEEADWKDICGEASKLGYRSHYTSTCGLHIHVNRDFFGEDVYERENNIDKVVYFVERHWGEIAIFTRRKAHELNEWASRVGYENRATCCGSKNREKRDRRQAINLTNRKTIEFRLFKGTLRPQTLFATLQFVHYVCMVAATQNEDYIRDTTWLAHCRVMKHAFGEESYLVKYLKQRGLYPCESAVTQEEV